MRDRRYETREDLVEDRIQEMVCEATICGTCQGAAEIYRHDRWMDCPKCDGGHVPVDMAALRHLAEDDDAWLNTGYEAWRVRGHG